MSHLTHNWNRSTTGLPLQHGRILDSHQDNLKMMHALFTEQQLAPDNFILPHNSVHTAESAVT